MADDDRVIDRRSAIAGVTAAGGALILGQAPKGASAALEQVEPYPLQAGEIGVVDRKYQWGDVRRYGAVIDGTTINTRAVQNGIDSMSNMSHGGSVLVPRGTCVTGPLILRFKASLVGMEEPGLVVGRSTRHGSCLKLAAGSNAPLIRNDRASGDVGGTGDDGATNRATYSRIENIFLDGNGTNQASMDADIVRLTGAWSTTIRRCTFVDSRGFGIRALDCNALHVVECRGSAAPVFLASLADSLFMANQWGGGAGPVYPVVWVAGSGGNGWQNVFAQNFFFNNANNTPLVMSRIVSAQAGLIRLAASHKLSDGTPVVFVNEGGDFPAGVDSGRTYYVKSVNDLSVRVATSPSDVSRGAFIRCDGGAGTRLGVGENCVLFLNDGARWNTFTANRIDQGYGHGVLLRTATENAFVGNVLNQNGMGNPTPQAGFALRAASRNSFVGNQVSGRPGTNGRLRSNQATGFDGDDQSADNAGDLSTQSTGHPGADVHMRAGFRTSDTDEQLEVAVHAVFPGEGRPGQSIVPRLTRPAWLFEAGLAQSVQSVVRPPRSWAGCAVSVRWTSAGGDRGTVEWQARVFSVSPSGARSTTPLLEEAVVASLVRPNQGIELTRLGRFGIPVPGAELLVEIRRIGGSSRDTLRDKAAFVSLVLERA